MAHAQSYQQLLLVYSCLKPKIKNCPIQLKNSFKIKNNFILKQKLKVIMSIICNYVIIYLIVKF